MSTKKLDVVSIQEALRTSALEAINRSPEATTQIIQIDASKTFLLPDDVRVNSFSAVVVDFTSTNMFYDTTFDAKVYSPPVCFAIGRASNEQLIPSKNSTKKQSESCNICPLNEFGSSGKGKACKNGITLALLPPTATKSTPIWLLKISPTALKSWGAYVRSVFSAFELPPIGVVTTFVFDDKVTYPSIRFVDPQPNNFLDVFRERQIEAQDLLELEPSLKQMVVMGTPKAVTNVSKR